MQTADKPFAEVARCIATAVASDFAGGGQGLANFLLHSLNVPLVQATHRAAKDAMDPALVDLLKRTGLHNVPGNVSTEAKLLDHLLYNAVTAAITAHDRNLLTLWSTSRAASSNA